MIKPLIESAEHTASAMIANAATEPHKSQKRLEPAKTNDKENDKANEMARRPADDDIETLREEAANCRACPLYKNATQTVFGEGPQHARVMLVGEQPGDKEDLAGKPFVGPAGQMLDRALEEAGIDRKKVYVTNAVKHFKFVPRQDPAAPEAEHAGDQGLPAVVRARTGDDQAGPGGGDGRDRRAMRIQQDHADQPEPRPPDRPRRRRQGAGDGASIYLLRLPDAEAKAREYQRFVDDLKIVAQLLRKLAQAA